MCRLSSGNSIQHAGRWGTHGSHVRHLVDQPVYPQPLALDYGRIYRRLRLTLKRGSSNASDAALIRFCVEFLSIQIRAGAGYAQRNQLVPAAISHAISLKRLFLREKPLRPSCELLLGADVLSRSLNSVPRPICQAYLATFGRLRPTRSDPLNFRILSVELAVELAAEIGVFPTENIGKVSERTRRDEVA